MDGHPYYTKNIDFFIYLQQQECVRERIKGKTSEREKGGERRSDNKRRRKRERRL